MDRQTFLTELQRFDLDYKTKRKQFIASCCSSLALYKPSTFVRGLDYKIYKIIKIEKVIVVGNRNLVITYYCSLVNKFGVVISKNHIIDESTILGEHTLAKYD